MTSSQIDAAFLDWFKQATELAWRNHMPRHFRLYERSGVGGLDWQMGTRWRGGLSDAEIDAVESRFGLAFPPDCRLFLSTLHTPDPPMVGASYNGGDGRHLTPCQGREFPDWTGDEGAVRDKLGWPLEGLLWSIEADASWHPAWGPRPETADERAGVVRRLASAAPPLIPVYGHSYLLGWPGRGGSQILSMYGADVIPYAPNLRAYLEAFVHHDQSLAPNQFRKIRIPFWSDVINDMGPRFPGATR